MADYVSVYRYQDKEVCLILDVETDPVFSFGQKLCALNPNAYMNGYNWDALLRYYLEKTDPDILIGMDPDPEAGSYSVHWPLSPENEGRAKRFEETIRTLITQEEELCRLVQEDDGAIEWD